MAEPGSRSTSTAAMTGDMANGSDGGEEAKGSMSSGLEGQPTRPQAFHQQPSQPSTSSGADGAAAADSTMAEPQQRASSNNASSRRDWHAEMLCGLFLRSEEKELEWLEQKVSLQHAQDAPQQYLSSKASDGYEGGPRIGFEQDDSLLLDFVGAVRFGRW